MFCLERKNKNILIAILIISIIFVGGFNMLPSLASSGPALAGEDETGIDIGSDGGDLPQIDITQGDEQFGPIQRPETSEDPVLDPELTPDNPNNSSRPAPTQRPAFISMTAEISVGGKDFRPVDGGVYLIEANTDSLFWSDIVLRVTVTNETGNAIDDAKVDIGVGKPIQLEDVNSGGKTVALGALADKESKTVTIASRPKAEEFKIANFNDYLLSLAVGQKPSTDVLRVEAHAGSFSASNQCRLALDR